MKKLSKLMCLLLAVGMLMGIASCSSDAGEGGGGSSGGTETVRISCGPLNGYQNVLYNSIADMMNKATPASTALLLRPPPAPPRMPACWLWTKPTSAPWAWI